MAQMPRERLDALGKARLDYQRREFDRDHWLDQLEKLAARTERPALRSPTIGGYRPLAYFDQTVRFT